MTLEVWAGLPLSLIESIGVVDLGFRKRPWAGDGGSELPRARREESSAVEEIGDIQYGKHYQEHAEGRACTEHPQPLGQLLRLRTSRIVPIQEDGCGNHH